MRIPRTLSKTPKSQRGPGSRRKESRTSNKKLGFKIMKKKDMERDIIR